jgi:toxin HigB-1
VIHYKGRGMIVRFRHKGLERLFLSDEIKGVPSDQVGRLKRVLVILHRASSPDAIIATPGLRLHPLKGDRRGYWSVSVTGNWRVVFRFDGPNVSDVDLVDYH